MRKLLKVLFSQLVIVSLLLIAQAALLVWFVMRLSEYFIYIDIALKIISFAVVIIIMNRHSNPVYKIAWIIPILLFPLIGGFLYLFIMGQTNTKRFFTRLKKLECETTAPYPQQEKTLSEIAQTDARFKGAVRYVNNVSHLAAYGGADTTYFPVGEELLKSLLSELEKAQKYIFMEFFILADGIMWQSILNILKRKAKDGVDVRIIYDGMGSMTLLPRSFPQQMQALGIKCRVFSPFVPFLSALQNNRDHRKIVSIDGKTAYTGGINIADEYINKGYDKGHWKDMGVMVKGQAAMSFTMMFMDMWCIITGEKPNIKSYEPQKWENYGKTGFVMPYSDMPQDKYQTGEYLYMDMINKAEKFVYITTPYLILDHEMTFALTNAAASGIDIKIICPRNIDHWYARAVAYSYYKELIQSGVKIYEYTPGFIHGKTFCCDGAAATVGSINLDYRSLYLHFECGAWFMDSPVVDAVLSDFNDTLKKCRAITAKECDSIHPLRKLLNALLRIFAPLM